MKRCIFTILLSLFAPSCLVAQQSQNSISIQGRLNSTDVVSGVQVTILANGVSVSTAASIDLAPDSNGVFTTFITGLNLASFQLPAGFFEVSLKKDDGEIAKIPLTAVPFSLAIRGVNPDDNIVSASGNVGIGTIEPDQKLTVAGNVLIDGDLYARNFVGAVMYFAGSSCPGGWLLADGSTQPVTGIYYALFTQIGYTYGGSEDYFRLPLMTDGSFIRGVGGYAKPRGQKQPDAFKSHTHTLPRRYGTNYGGVTSAMGSSIWSPIESYPAGEEETRPLNYAMIPCIKY